MIKETRVHARRWGLKPLWPKNDQNERALSDSLTDVAFKVLASGNLTWDEILKDALRSKGAGQSIVHALNEVLGISTPVRQEDFYLWLGLGSATRDHTCFRDAQ